MSDPILQASIDGMKQDLEVRKQTIIAMQRETQKLIKEALHLKKCLNDMETISKGQFKKPSRNPRSTRVLSI
ncbi:MAG: hypothetical protein AAB638_00860 [Patescibacteria group bacterium]